MQCILEEFLRVLIDRSLPALVTLRALASASELLRALASASEFGRDREPAGSAR